MLQGRLFDFSSPDMTPAKHLARTDDPETSKQAAEAIVDQLAALHTWTLQCVQERPGLTAMELAKHFCPLDPRKIGRRLPELEKAGKLRRETRACSITHRQASTWFAV
jgi:hypothetical protein